MSDNLSTTGTVGGSRIIEKTHAVQLKDNQVTPQHPQWKEILQKVDKGSFVKVQHKRTGAIRSGKVSFIEKRSESSVIAFLDKGAYGEVIAVTSGPGIDGERNVVTSVVTEEEEDFFRQQQQQWHEEKEEWKPARDVYRERQAMNMQQNIRVHDLWLLYQEFHSIGQNGWEKHEIEEMYDLCGCKKDQLAQILRQARKNTRQMPRNRSQQLRQLLQSM